MLPQLLKARDWLTLQTDGKYYPVVASRRGYSEFIAYIYKIPRLNKPSLWFIMEVDGTFVTKIKRICVY